MNTQEVQELADLARLNITEDKAQQLQGEFAAILEYVGTINKIVAEGGITKVPGVRHNIMREDQVTNEPGEYTEAIVGQMPETEGVHLKVKKIIAND